METVLPSEFTPAALEGADFDALVQAHRPGVYRFLLASLRDRPAAEDLTQECFLRAYRGWTAFRGDAGVRTWLMQIAVNLVRSHTASARFRFWRRREDVTFELADGQRSPEESAQAHQKVAAIWKVAQGLPQQQRTVFFLRFVEDMEILEIAAATGLAEGTVKAHMYRALEAVRKRLGEMK